MPAPGRRSPRPSRRGGFALLITVTLLAFLVLLLVSLASLTRVETQVATNSAQLAQARANALFALNLAMGQLQRYAGPDQAVTARADIDAANTGNPLWTGVWDAVPRDGAGGALATPTHAGAPASSAPLAWLVSGNETGGTAATPAAAPVAKPDTAPDNVWLVREVLGNDLSDTSVYPTDRGIRLAKQPVLVPAAHVPGAEAAGAPVRVGSYAWWVGDEGVKAKINLGDPYRTATAASAEAGWRRGAAPRPDLQLLDKPEFAAAFAGTTSAFEASRTGLLAYEQLPLLHADLAAAVGNEQAGGYFYDVTTVGRGVLADTLRGGLRRDLTRGLAAAPAGGSVAATEIGGTQPVFTAPMPGPYGRVPKGPVSALWSPGVEPKAPSWGAVRGWTGMRAPADGAARAPVSAPITGTGTGTQAPADGQALVPIPVVVQIGYGFDIGPDLKLRLTLLPRVVLLNPYNVPLAEADYTVCYIPSIINGDDWRLLGGLDYTPADPTKKATAKLALREYLPLLRLAFNIRTALKPGEVRVFSIGAGADNTQTTGLLQLEPGVTTAYAYATHMDPTKDISETWFAEPDKIRARIESMPRDHPQITIAVGVSTLAGGTLTVPDRSFHARYIPAEAAYVNPQTPSQRPNALMGAGGAKMLRMLRFSLRDGGIDRIGNGNHQGDSETYIGATTPADPTSGVRMLIDNNPRAVLSQMVSGWRSVAQYVTTVANKGTADAELDYDAENAFWGGSHADDSTGSSSAILFDVLRENEEPVSLGRLAHVNWGVDGKHPAYPLGNSFSSVFYPAASPDYGYALNEAVWDRFFFSTLPASLAVRPAQLPNTRLAFHEPAGAAAGLAALEGGNGYTLAATRLMIDGAFNINSTSVAAWTAFLGSVQAADYAYQGRSGARTDTGVRAFPRVAHLHDSDPTAAGQAGNQYEWTGYRKLDATQLKALAVEIVAGIRARGRPARSLAEFMNRDLSQPATSVRNQEGIVQAALDAVVNTPAAVTGMDGLNSTKVVLTSFSTGDNPDAARGRLRTAGAPGYLMQSDLLTPLASAMAARSDTFRVRTYGEARNPVTGEINGRVWCEAIVQRVPEFAGGEAAETKLSDLTAGGESATFGRRFVVTQFRWLGADEI